VSDNGIYVTDDDGYIAFHSDYSSVVYIGEFDISASPVQVNYTGDYEIPMTATVKSTYYDLGWIVQFRINTVADYILPFYNPNFNGQKIAIMDMIRDGTSWVVNMVYSGNANSAPRLFCFAPLASVVSPTPNDWGVSCFDADGNLIFTDSMRPLKVDDVVQVTHPTTIRSGGGTGTCSSSTCHIDYTPTEVNRIHGTHTQTATQLYHCIPSAYGGLAYKNSGSGSSSCGFLGLGDRPWAWGYQSWASFRGAIAHTVGTDIHDACYVGDFCGALYSYQSGSCGISGWLGAVIGAIVGAFTFGVGALIVAGGALAGFAVASFFAPTFPNLRAYENDVTFDTSNPFNLVLTDMAYYGIDNIPVVAGGDTIGDVATGTGDSGTGTSLLPPDDPTWVYGQYQTYWLVRSYGIGSKYNRWDNPLNGEIRWNYAVAATVDDNFATSWTTTSYIYYRGFDVMWENTIMYPYASGDRWEQEYKYEVARQAR
jgi:hypothetical protein